MRVSKFLSTLAVAGALTLTASTALAQSASDDLAVSGMLSSRDSHDSEGHFFRSRSITLRAGDTVEITAQSSEFDTVLRVAGPGGFTAMNDDDASSQGTNSRLSFRAPATGSYRLTVTSYNANETGSYQLAITHGVAVSDDSANSDDGSNDNGNSNGSQNDDGSDTTAPANDGAIPPQPQAWAWNDAQHMFVAVNPPSSANTAANNDGQDGNEEIAQNPANPFTPDANAGTGTVYGVFVGVSNYGGSNNLDDTANDARNLERAFESRGLIRHGNGIVLTDDSANSSQVRQAFRTLAQRVTARDTFVFFFDGHGDANEVELQSGPLTGSELSGMLDGVRGQQLVVLDSCYSGSIASIISGHANRVGLFSSRANETSYVASEVNAGGWLAYFMIQGVQHGIGGADGAAHVADVVNYVQHGYGQRVGSRQHLVVASGESRTATLWHSPSQANSVAMAR